MNTYIKPYKSIYKSNKQKLTEKVSQSERELIRKDPRFKVGIEYEMMLGNNRLTDIIDTLKKAGLRSVKYFDTYHGGVDYKGWRAEPDTSLGSNGIEIISPPEKVEDAFRHMNLLFRIMEDRKLYTTNKTGLHVNISKSRLNLSKRLDILKLALFMEEGKVWKYFTSRKNNKYTLSVIDSILEKGDIDSLSTQSMSKIDLISSDIKKLIPEAKYYGLNLSKIKKQNYIEFRYLGGDNYEKDSKRIQSFIEEFCYLILLSSDPDFKRKEYIQKLLRLKNKLLTLEPKEFVVYVEISYGEGGTETYTEEDIFNVAIRTASSSTIEWGDFPKYSYDRELENRLFTEYKEQLHYYIKYHFKKFETISEEMFQEKINIIKEDAFVGINYDVIEYAPIDYDKVKEAIIDEEFNSFEDIIKELTSDEYEAPDLDKINSMWQDYNQIKD